MKRLTLLFSFLFITLSGFAQTLKDALRLTDNEQYDIADGVYKSLIQKEPNNGTAWFYYGENFWKWENPDSAEICYQRGLQVEPANPLNLVGIGKCFLEKDALSEAKANFDKALSVTGPKLSQVQMEVAEAYIRSAKNKNLDYAMVLLQKAAIAEPNNPEIFVLMGDVFSERNDGTSAAEKYNKALDLDNNFVKAVVRKGMLYKRSKNLEIAQSEFENAIKIDSMFAPAHRELGEIFIRQRKLNEATAEYRKYLDLSKNTSIARLRYASFLFLSKDYQGTLNEITQLSKMDPANTSLLRLYAYTYYEMGDSVKALQHLNNLFEKVEESKRTQKDYEYYAKTLSKAGQDSLAVIYFQKAYSMDSTNTELLIELGTVLMKMKKYSEAASVFQQRVDFGKGVTSTDYYSLGRAYSSAKEYLKADSAFAKVNELLPNWANGWFWRAQVNANIDSTSEKGLAKPHYEKYIELALADTANYSKHKNNIVEGYRYLGYYYYRQKHISASKEYWRKVLEIFPNDKQATDVLEGFKQEQKEK